VYRDGVGDSQRNDVLQKEVSQFYSAIEELYNKASKKPFITVVIVNKRINQRFFTIQGKSVVNPTSGTLIDSTVVESAENNTEYDFYLIPQNTTQGCVTPTHFYVAYDNSPLKKDVLEKLTFDLCYYYFNWQGPIKVPAPCMYAHKMAELYVLIDNKGKNKTQFTPEVTKSFHFL